MTWERGKPLMAAWEKIVVNVGTQQIPCSAGNWIISQFQFKVFEKVPSDMLRATELAFCRLG